MQVARGLDHLPPSEAPVFVVVGVFDGLHLGHAYLLEHLVAEAGRRAARPVVITFDHHPDEILTGSAPPLLCDPDERLERLAAAGVDTTVVVHFDKRLRETPYDAFVAMIAARAPLAGFLMTPDAAFGYQRAGTPEALAALGAERGFEVVVVPPFELDGRPVRSTDVRAAIASGDLGTAAALPGRAHCVVGRAMEPAAGRGSVLRFPLPVALPPDGSYDVEVGPVHAPSPDRAAIEEGSVRLADTTPAPWVRVAFPGGSRR
jgi:riboflavin kinase / FMN adenylyltransferase